MDSHRDVVLDVHVPRIPVVLLERAREIVDSGEHPDCAPHPEWE